MRLPKFILAFGLMIAFSGIAGLNSANATDHYQPRAQCGYKTIVITVEKEVPYRTKVLRYTSCGKRYYKWVTRYKIIEVPVEIQVPKKRHRYGHGYGY